LIGSFGVSAPQTEDTQMEALSSILTVGAAGTAGTVLRYAAAFFLVVVAIAMVYMLVRAGRALQSVDKLVVDLDHEVMPVIQKAGTTVDEVNAELDKVNDITASVAEMTERVDSATRAVETVLSTPAKKAASFTNGVSQTMSSFFHRRTGSWAEAAEDERWQGSSAPAAAAGSSWEGSWQAPPSGAADAGTAGAAAPDTDTAGTADAQTEPVAAAGADERPGPADGAAGEQPS
jgi:uncharacterized protein YoxC